MYELKLYQDEFQNDILRFYTEVLPESGRKLELNGRHKVLSNISKHYEKYWCLYDEYRLIGTVAVRGIDEQTCELKSLYLYRAYQGKGLGYRLLSKAIEYAREKGYLEMYLDTLSTSERAIRLYQSAGFTPTNRYNDNQFADVFMVLKLSDCSVPGV